MPCGGERDDTRLGKMLLIKKEMKKTFRSHKKVEEWQFNSHQLA